MSLQQILISGGKLSVCGEHLFTDVAVTPSPHPRRTSLTQASLFSASSASPPSFLSRIRFRNPDFCCACFTESWKRSLSWSRSRLAIANRCPNTCIKEKKNKQANERTNKVNQVLPSVTTYGRGHHTRSARERGALLYGHSTSIESDHYKHADTIERATRGHGHRRETREQEKDKINQSKAERGTRGNPHREQAQSSLLAILVGAIGQP